MNGRTADNGGLRGADHRTPDASRILLLQAKYEPNVLVHLEGFQWLPVSDLASFDETIESEDFDGVVIEGVCNLPGLAERLRTLSEEDMPIIVVGDPSAPGLIDDTLAIEMDAFLDVRWPPAFIARNLSAAIESVQMGRNMVAIQRNVMDALEVAQKDLIRAREEALETARQKSGFLATMSHEIRTPLNGVLGMTLLALDGTLDTKQRECLEIAYGSAQGLLEIVNDVLDISKIDSGCLVLEAASFDLQRLISQALVPLAVSAADKGVALKTRIADGIPRHFIGDETRLKQVLLNLIGNAVKFSSDGSVTLSVEHDPSRPQTHLRFTIEDEGVGIPDDALDRIFEKYAQADDSMTRRFGGTGLGLPICKELVQLMDGHIEVDSTLGRGSRFRVIVRLPTDTTTNDISSEAQFVTRVLFVGATNSKIASVVSSHGGEVTVVPSTSAALTALDADTSYQLIILDAASSGKYLATDFVKALVQHPAGALVAISAGLASIRLIVKSPEVILLPGVVFPENLVGLLDQAQRGTPRAQSTLRNDRKPLALNDLAAEHPLNVLVAEDNRVNQMVIERLLLRMGHAVTVVADGKAAIEAVQRAIYDVVLMDLQMPELDGAAAADAIRQRELGEGGRRLPIYALTANKDFFSTDPTAEMLMDGLLTKPVDAKILAATLDTVASSLRGKSEAE